MKLKRLLSGVTAAIMIASSVAIASFSSVSAAEVAGITPPTGGWWTPEKQIDTSKYTLYENYEWNTLPKVSALDGATELYVAFQMIKVSSSKPLVAWLCHQNADQSDAWTNFDIDEETPLVRLDKERGTYVVHWKGSPIANTQLMHLSVQFAYADPDGDGAKMIEETDLETGLGTGKMVPEKVYNAKYCDTTENFTLLGVYTKEPDYDSLPQPPEAEPTEPIPEGALPVYLVDNDFFPITDERVDVTADGTYTFEAEGLNKGTGETSILLYSEGAIDIISENTKVVLNEILINGQSYAIPRYWSRPVAPFEAIMGTEDLFNDYFWVCFWNAWWDDTKNPHNIKLYGDEVIHEISITFTLTGTGLGGGSGSSNPTKPSDNPDNPSSNSSGSNSSNSSNPTNSKPTSAKPSTTAPKATRSPAQVTKDKNNAQKAMNQAKITSLKAKAKGKKKITVSWKKVTKAVGYEVEVAKNNKFKKNVIKKTTSSTKVVINKLKSKKTYFVRVRAYATYNDKNNKPVNVYSKWIKKVRKVKVK